MNTLKKALVLIYDSFAEFEISILLTCLNSPQYKVETFSVKKIDNTVISTGGMKYTPHFIVDEINPEEYEILIIPGGIPAPLMNDERLLSLLQAFFNQNKLLAAICAGPALLGAAGILDNVQFATSLDPSQDSEYLNVMNWENKQKELLVVDQGVITATGSNYLNFAEEILIQLGIHQREEKDCLKYFRTPSAG